METKEVVLLWIIAFSAMFVHYGVTLLTRKKDNKKPFSLEYWIKDNYISMIVSGGTVILLMMVFMPKTILEQLDPYVMAEYGIIASILYKKVIAMLIGYLNVLILDKIIRKAKDKFQKKMDSI